MRNANSFSTGVCKCFGRDYGFLIEDHSGDEVFCHFSGIVQSKASEFRVLIPGARYEFKKVQSAKKLGCFEALCVTQLENENDNEQHNLPA